MITVCTLLIVATARNCEIHQMDVYNIFFLVTFPRKFKLPPGFSRGPNTQVCKLRKFLYGPKQATNCLFVKLTFALKASGFCQSYFAYSLFSYYVSDIFLCVLVYVDDLIMTENNSAAL